MPLLATGKKFIRDLESAGALGVYAPLEGGVEGRYRRRLRTRGYVSHSLSARGMGDLSSYLTAVHGVRPPHLGKKTIGQDAQVGDVFFVPGIATTQLDALPEWANGLVLWIIEGYVLAQQEQQYLTELPKIEPRLKVVLELGGDRYFRWQPLSELIAA